MNQELPGSAPDGAKSSSENAERSLDEISKAHLKGQDAVRQQFGTEMDKESRCAEIGSCMLELATTNADGEEHLAPYLEHKAFPDGTNAVLYDYEIKKRASKPDFDVTGLSPKKLARLLSRKFDTEAQEAEAIDRNEADTQDNAEEIKANAELEDDKKNEADSSEDEAQGYEAFVQSLKGSNIDKISAMLASDQVPETEKARLRAFQSILSIAAAVPEDQQIIKSRLNGLDFSKSIPSPRSFATWAIFDSPNAPTGISESTQNAVAASLGIKRNKYRVQSGGDVNDVFERGYGTETYIDENGEEQSRTIPLDPDHEVKIRDNQYLSVDEAGNRKLRLETSVGSYQVRLPENPTDQDMTEIVASTQMIGLLHNYNLAELLYERPIGERGGGELELRFPGDFNRTKYLQQDFKGGAAGYNGKLLEQSDIDKIPYLLQFHSSKGDAIRGDVDRDLVRKDFEAQGVLDEGTVNWAKFEQLVTANRENMYVAPENFTQD